MESSHFLVAGSSFSLGGASSHSPAPFALCHQSRGEEQVLCSSRTQTDFTEIIPPHRFPRAHGTEAVGLFSYCSLDGLFVRVAQSKTGSALCRLSRPLKVYCT